MCLSHSCAPEPGIEAFYIKKDKQLCALWSLGGPRWSWSRRGTEIIETASGMESGESAGQAHLDVSKQEWIS